MHRLLATGLCGLVLLAGPLVGTSSAAPADRAKAPVAGRSAASTSAELPRTGVSAVDVAKRVVTLVDGRRLRYDGNDTLVLALAYMSADNVQFTTPVSSFTATPAWYATLEGTYHQDTRKVSHLRLTVVSEPTTHAKALCQEQTGDPYGGPCARPEATTPVTWSGTRATTALS